MGEWQPIDSAPRDVAILAWDGISIGVVQYADWAELNNPWRSVDDSGIRYTATHWQSLPAPPGAA